MRTQLLSQTLLLMMLATRMTPALGQTPIPLDELPPPPPELKRLIETGRVVFETGQRVQKEESASDENPNRGFGTASRMGSGGQLTAETRFQIASDWDTKTSWRVISGSRELRIWVTLRQLRWQPSHLVWLRAAPQPQDFWSSRLVLHELDHVRLSSDPRMKGTFEEMFRKPMVIRHQLAKGERAGQQLVNRLSDEHMQHCFQERLELIKIRYRELDRDTSHGKAALERDSALYELLRSDPPPSQ